jgi:hypothetical protein
MNEPHVVDCPVRRVDPGPQSFFGYYDRCPWSHDQRRLLIGRASIGPRRPTADDPLELLLLDVASGEAAQFATSHAWDWQMGCRMQWLDDGRILHNDRRDGRVVSVIRDADGREQRELTMPVIDTHGTTAVTLNFARLDLCRPGYGVMGTGYSADVLAPDDDGLFRVDLDSGRTELLVSFARLRDFAPHPTMDQGPGWMNHLMLNPSGTRVAFLHRWGPMAQPPWTTRLFTCDLDGGRLHLLNPEPFTSHCFWFDDEHMLTWCGRDDRQAYWLMTDLSDQAVSFGDDWFDRDGHCSFSPDRKWMLTDTYPHGADHRKLLLFRWPDGPRYDVGRFFDDPAWKGANRCDLHPRFSRDGRSVCIDATHEGERGVYVVDVSGVVGQG